MHGTIKPKLKILARIADIPDGNWEGTFHEEMLYAVKWVEDGLGGRRKAKCSVRTTAMKHDAQ